MLTHFALSGLAEWTVLSRAQRRFVWHQYLYPLTSQWQMRLAKFCVGLLGIVIAFRLGAFDRMSTTVIMLFIVIFLLPDLFDTLVIARHRRQVSSFIHSHGPEIQTAA
jgi:hypothetical protein